MGITGYVGTYGFNQLPSAARYFVIDAVMGGVAGFIPADADAVVAYRCDAS